MSKLKCLASLLQTFCAFSISYKIFFRIYILLSKYYDKIRLEKSYNNSNDNIVIYKVKLKAFTKI